MFDVYILFIPLTVLIGGVGFIYLGVYSRMKARELAHRERLAMIERGLVPAPESDPAKFYSAVVAARGGNRSTRQRSAGVMIVGLGLALIMIISFVANDTQLGLGVGGAVTILGIAMLVNAYLGRADQPVTPPSISTAPAPPAPPPGEPPHS